MIEHLYNIPLPNGLNKREANAIIDAGKWASLAIENHPKLAVLLGSELAQTIKNEINLAAKKNQQLKYLLFVAHDTTISKQLKFLGQTIDDIPSYASRLNYSLFDMGAYNYEVRVTYDHKPLLIESCGGYSCTLSQFNNMIDNQIIVY